MHYLNSKFSWQFVLRGFLSFVCILLFIFGFFNYSGSVGYYVVFSAIFFLMLGSGFFRQKTYGYLFLVIFLWLGFWLKFTVHQIFDYPFGEPVGLFDGSPSSWDRVLLVATVGAAGVIIARVAYGFFGLSTTILDISLSKAPYWYTRVWKILWTSLTLVLIACAVANGIYGIQQSGLVPRTILIWPLNAVIYWMLSTGFAMCAVTLLWWHIGFVKNISFHAYVILGEAAVTTLSLLSRGVYVFHVIPVVVGLYMNRVHIKTISALRIFLYIFTFLVLMFTTLSLVNTLRGYYYSNVPTVFIDSKGAEAAVGTFSKFFVERWVGLEGVMAVSAFPKKGSDLFLEALTEKAEIGKSTLYQKVSLAHYRFMDMTKFQFASLPGAIAFFYYTNSLLMVMLGMMLLTIILLFSEKMVHCLTANPLLSSFWGCAVANTIAQLGVAPSGLLPYFTMSLAAILAIKFIQSNRFSLLLQWIGLRSFATD